MHKFSNARLPRELESWITNPVMRSPDSASVRQSLLARGVICTSIRHRELQGIDSDMIYEWYKYFCYQNLLLANGKMISAFELWHPADHVSFEIQKHSLSGDIGLAKGAIVSVVEKHRNKLLSNGSAKILDLSKKRFSVKHKNDVHNQALVSDDFVDTKKGLLMISNLVKVANRFKNDSSTNWEGSEIDSRTDVQNWIEHKVEEIGNLELILPSVIKSGSRSIHRFLGSRSNR